MKSIFNSLNNKFNALKTDKTFNDIMQTLDENGFIAEKTQGQKWFWLQFSSEMGDSSRRKMVPKQDFVDKVYERLNEGYNFEAAIVWTIKFFLQ